MKTPKHFKFNTAQLFSLMFPDVKVKYNISGRGTGKSQEAAYDSALMAHEMPGASFVFAGRTYALLEGITLPGIIAGWKNLGYYEGVHYEIKRKPDKSKNWPDPFVKPLSYDHYIPWYTGAGFYLTSQDKDVPFRGPSIDGIYIDEALTIKKDRFDEEIAPTNRGRRFNHPLHHFYRFYSTKPLGSDGAWLYDNMQYYGEEKINRYRRIQKELVELFMEFIDGENRERQKLLYNEIIKCKRQIIWQPSSDMKTMYMEFDFFENLGNVTLEDVRQMKKVMSSIKFRTEVLNETLEEIENGFYPTFDARKHVLYDTFNYGHVDHLDKQQREQRDFRWDNDLVYGQPLKHVVDWGGWINSSLTWQRNDRVININNHQWVLHPRKIKDLAQEFLEYYKGYPTKRVLLYNDHTGNNKKDNSKLTSTQEYTQYLTAGGWEVTKMSKGGAPSHEEKFYLNQKVLAEEDNNQPIVRINGNNCPQLITSIKLSPIKRGNKTFEKDKSSERDPNFPQYQATHASDCFDIIIGAEASRKGRYQFIDPVF